MSSVKERTKAASASFSSASAGIAGKMSSLGSTLKKEANSLRKDVAAIMTEKDDRKPGDDAVTATSSGSAGMGPAALRPNELSPSQSGSAGVGPAALRSNELPPGQLRCFSCAMLMAYPPGQTCYTRACKLPQAAMCLLCAWMVLMSGTGVMQVRCPGCNTINNTPPPPAVSDVERGMGALNMVTQVLDPRANASTAQVRPQAPGAVNPVYGQQGVEASEEAMIQEAIRISLGQATARLPCPCRQHLCAKHSLSSNTVYPKRERGREMCLISLFERWAHLPHHKESKVSTTCSVLILSFLCSGPCRFEPGARAFCQNACGLWKRQRARPG